MNNITPDQALSLLNAADAVTHCPTASPIFPSVIAALDAEVRKVKAIMFDLPGNVP